MPFLDRGVADAAPIHKRRSVSMREAANARKVASRVRPQLLRGG